MSSRTKQIVLSTGLILVILAIIAAVVVTVVYMRNKDKYDDSDKEFVR